MLLGHVAVTLVIPHGTEIITDYLASLSTRSKVVTDPDPNS